MTVHDTVDCGLAGLEAGLVPKNDEDSLLDQCPSNPSRGLDWRWIVAAHLARTRSHARLRWLDAPVRRAVDFLRAFDRPKKSGRRKSPAVDGTIAGAVALRSGPTGATRIAIESLLLAGLDDLAASTMAGVDAEVVAAFHDLFFDVRPLLGHPDAVLARAFGPSIYLPSADVGLAVRLLSYLGGPVVARGLVEAILRPGAADDAPGDDHRELVEHFEEFVLAASLPVDGRGALAVLGLHAQAERLARDGAGGTVAGVTRPLAIGVLDAPDWDQAGDSGRDEGTNGPSACSKLRADGTPGGVAEGVDDGRSEVGERLGMVG